jgi:hypothetical protein
LIGIRTAKQIVNIKKPLRNVVDRYASGTGPAPTLEPMRFSFEVPFAHEWNQEIQDKFISAFLLENEVLDDDVPMLYAILKQLYTNLRRYIIDANVREEEDEVQARKRVKETEESRQKSSRRFTRKRTVSNFASR